MNQYRHILERFRCAVIALAVIAVAFAGCKKQDANRPVPQQAGKFVSQASKTQENSAAVATRADRAHDKLSDDVPPKPATSGPGYGTNATEDDPTANPATSAARCDGATSKARTRDPRSAEAQATPLIAEAEKAGEKGNTSKAFELAVRAWVTVRAHTDDALCRELADKALRLTERFGEAANSRSGSVDRLRPITVK